MCPPSGNVTSGASPVANPTGTPSCVPKDEISQAAYKHAASLLHPLILNHSIRVFELSRALSEIDSGIWHHGDRLPLLFTACIFHDIGTTDHYDTKPIRFEIEGADAARLFLYDYGVSKDDLKEVWMAIALHDTPQVAERIDGLVRLVRLGVMADFKRPAALDLFSERTVTRLESDFPRGAIEKVLGDGVVEQALRRPEEERRGKAPNASWPGGMLDAKVKEPEWDGVNKAF